MSRIPVLDDDTITGSVIGYAKTERGAARCFRRRTGQAAAGWRQRREPVSHHPDINTPREARAVERNGAWAPIYLASA